MSDIRRGLILDVSSRKGNVSDSLGNALTNTGVICKKRDKGIEHIYDGSSTLNFGDILDMGLEDRTLVTRFKTKSTSRQDLIGKASGSGSGRYWINLESVSGIIKLGINGSILYNVYGTSNLFDNKYHTVISVMDRDGLMSLYVDGILEDSIDISSQVNYDMQSSYDLQIGHLNGVSPSYFTGSITNSRMYNRVLSSDEIIELTDYLNQDFSLSIQKSGFNYPKPISLNDDRLVGAWNMIPSTGGIIPDISGNGNDFVLYGNPLSNKDGMRFDSTNILSYGQTESSVNTGDVITVLFYGELDNVQTRILSSRNGTDGFELHANNSGNLTAWINNISFVANTYVLDKECSIAMVINGENSFLYFCGERVLEFDSSELTIASDILRLNLFASGIGIQNISELRLYNEALSDDEIRRFHNKYASQAIFKDNFELEYADDTTQVPLEWRAYEGTFEIEENNKNKYLRNVSAGQIFTQSKQAYGTWEFDVSITDLLGYSVYRFIENNFGNLFGGANGYQIDLTSTGAITLDKRVNGSRTILFTTADSYIEIDEIYRIKVTRNYTGLFTVYIKGGSFGDVWTLIDSVTDTTFATSKYFGWTSNNGDLLGNILIKKGIEV